MTTAKKNNVVELFKKNVEPEQESTFLPHKMYPINPHKIVAQTSNAICFEARIEYRYPSKTWDYTLSCWFPKSMMVNVFLPGWLFMAKAKDARQELLRLEDFLELFQTGKIHLSDFFLRVDDYLINLDADFLK